MLRKEHDGGDDGPGPEPISFNSKFGASINVIMSFSIDVVVVINDYHHLMGRGGRAFIKELHIVMYIVTAMAPATICIYYHEEKTSA